MKTRLSVISVICASTLCHIASGAQDSSSTYGASLDQSAILLTLDSRSGQASFISDPGTPTASSENSPNITLASEASYYNPTTSNASTGRYQVGLSTGLTGFMGIGEVYVDYTPADIGGTKHKTSIDVASLSTVKSTLPDFSPNQHEAGLAQEDIKSIPLDSHASGPANFELCQADLAGVPGLTQAIPEPGVLPMVFLGVAVLAFWRGGPLLAKATDALRAKVRKAKYAEAYLEVCERRA